MLPKSSSEAILLARWSIIPPPQDLPILKPDKKM